MVGRVNWTEDEVKRALYLYFQLPFGQLHSGNGEIIALANALGRTPSSVAMKLSNFASLDPVITASGRKGLSGASALDRRVWEQFDGDWTKLVIHVGVNAANESAEPKDRVEEDRASYLFETPSGATTTRTEVEIRIGQSFFRRSVLANFENTCCVTGIADARLLNASHISPWTGDVVNRHNPRNGLSLSATFDRAFDRCLMTVTPDLTVRLSSQLLDSKSEETRQHFLPFDGVKLKSPTHLAIDVTLLKQHNAQFIS